MSRLKVDTAKYNELVSSLNTCVQLYNNSIDSFFNEINSASWEGDAATKYKEASAIEKAKYVSFGESMIKYVDTLYEIGSSLESTVSSAR